MLEWFEEHTGRPCPRVLLHPENFDAWRLLHLGLGEDVHGLAAAYGAGLAHYLDRSEYRRVFGRVQAVRADPKFIELLEDEMEKARDKTQQTRDEKDGEER